MNPVIINLDLEFKYVITPLDVVIKLDDKVILSGPQTDTLQSLKIETKVNPGEHTLTIDLLNKNYSECTPENDAAVIIHSVKFQHLNDEFSHHSWYRPEYPDNWTDSKPEVMHSNYMGWNGRWGFDFNTPIYPWIHKTLNLGWLLS